jgi:H+/Cl- antiporter ClcA
MEMTDGHTLVLSLMAATLLASMISRAISAPLYASLALQQLHSMAQSKTTEVIQASVAPKMGGQ